MKPDIKPDEYTEILGKQIRKECFEDYVEHIRMRLEILDLGGLGVNTSTLEFERQALHDEILRDACADKDSQWAIDFAGHVCKQISLIRGED